jgi:N-acetylglucosaminyldiphosphoundecaprenol N-acetyl-beta-D-mannosaminyltransferase
MTTNILGVTLHKATTREALELVEQKLQMQEQCRIVTVNPEFIMTARKDPHFRAVLNSSCLALPDGIGVLWAGVLLQERLRTHWMPLKYGESILRGIWTGIRVLGSSSERFSSFPERITGVDFSYHLANLSDKKGYTLFLLGEREGVGAKVRDKLCEQFPRLKVSGIFSGNGAPEGDERTRKAIQDNPADIILVAYGAPKQEFWIERNMSTLPITVAMGVGGTFLYISGEAQRAPSWVQRIGFEWLYRLVNEPWRLKRQLVLPWFIIQVILEKARHG